MIVAGLTGGICSGKSTVSKILVSNGILVIDGDKVARDVVILGSPGLAQIISEFGLAYLNADGSLNRKLLGDLVFNNSGSMKKLNEIMEPLIESEVQQQIKIGQEAGNSIIVFDSVLICETHSEDKYRPLIATLCQTKQQIERLMERGTGHGPLTREQALARISCQMPMLIKANKADWIIDTSQTVKHSIEQTEEIIQKLREMAL
jgi:dephospho-CoA kinase